MTDQPRRAYVLTVSDGVAAGTRRDESGSTLVERLSTAGYAVERGVVADDAAEIAAAVLAAADGHDIVITTGGTGLTPRDVTPQALLPLLDYLVPGLGEAMRADGRRSTPFAVLSRSFGGVIGAALVLAVPGSPNGALESLEAVLPVLTHAHETLAGDSGRHRADGQAEAPR
jgi:molybdenum cofactor synthesis domain-containing protein